MTLPETHWSKLDGFTDHWWSQESETFHNGRALVAERRFDDGRASLRIAVAVVPRRDLDKVGELLGHMRDALDRDTVRRVTATAPNPILHELTWSER